MKVLIISDYNAPYAGNFIESIKALNDYANTKKSQFYYLFPRRCHNKVYMKDLEKISGHSITYFVDDTVLNAYFTIRKLALKEKIDIIYCHFCRPKTQIAIKIFCILHKNIKLVSHFHNHCKNSNNIIKNLFYKFAYQFYKGNLNIGCSKSVMESMPFPEKIKTYVNNAINFKRLDKFQQLDLSQNRKYVILMFGFDYYRKGIDLAIKALNSINEDITLAISLASNKGKVKKYIEEEFGYIPAFIEFLEPLEEVGTYYKNVDIFLSAAREEGFCYSLVEAAYCNTKIISSNIDGVPKDIPGEQLFKAGDSLDLAKVIKKALKSQTNQHAKKYVINNYGIECWVKNVMNKIEICQEKESNKK